MGRLIALTDRCLNHEDLSFAARRALGFLALLLLLAIVFGRRHSFQPRAGRTWTFRAPPPSPSPRLSRRASSRNAASTRMSLPSRRLSTRDWRRAACLWQKSSAATSTNLDETGVARAAIESLAENFSDGVVAPAFWLALGGLPVGVCYKAINTADSMIGHRTKRHAAFGFAAAKLDDLVEFVRRAAFGPSRRDRGFPRAGSLATRRLAHSAARRARTCFPQCRLARGGLRRRPRRAAWRPARLWRGDG